MNIVLLGPPGVGKGTQAQRLCAHFRLTHLSTGDMLRDHAARLTLLGKEAKNAMDAGELVSDDIIIGMVEEALGGGGNGAVHAGGGGFLFDGFPRTLAQAEKLSQKNLPDIVVDLDLDDEQIVARLSGRWVHPASGRTYHIRWSPPQRAGQDDATGDALVQRDDDKEDTVRSRLEVYRRQTLPLIEYYRRQATVGKVRAISCSGEGDITDISRRLIARITAGDG